jgi:hypothetical protein
MPDSSAQGEFVMYGARAAMASGLTHIEEQVKAIERAIVENPGLALDLAKTIVESTCRTILNERKVPFKPDDDVPKLFKAVTSCLPLLPMAASGEATARKSLAQTVGGLRTALQGICELRNAYGFASHGTVGPRPSMGTAQALLVAQTADAIVGFAFEMHRGQKPPTPARAGPIETVDKVIDANYEPVSIADQPYAVSEALYSVDREAYLAIAAAVKESRNVRSDLAAKYPDSLKPEVEEVSFVHFDESVFLKVVISGTGTNLTDTEFIRGEGADQLFSARRSPEENANLLLSDFDPYSIINCFELFTSEAAAKIAQEFEAHRPEALITPTGGEDGART